LPLPRVGRVDLRFDSGQKFRIGLDEIRPPRPKGSREISGCSLQAKEQRSARYRETTPPWLHFFGRDGRGEL
jgi:hypothetical protein